MPTTPTPDVAELALKALAKITMYARTSGGTAGPDPDLMAACEEAEEAIAALRSTQAAGAVAWRYQDSRGHYRYCGHKPEHPMLKPVPLYLAQPAPAVQADPLWPIDGLYPDMQPPATSRDRWMFDQGRLAERRASAVQAAQGLVPLTNEQIEDCIDAAIRKFNGRRQGPCGQLITTYDDWKYWLVREVEAAHGIRPVGDEGAGNG